LLFLGVEAALNIKHAAINKTIIKSLFHTQTKKEKIRDEEDIMSETSIIFRSHPSIMKYSLIICSLFHGPSNPYLRNYLYGEHNQIIHIKK